MKKLLSSTLVVFAFATASWAQKTSLSVELIHSAARDCYFRIPAWGFMYDHLDRGSRTVPINQGKGHFDLELTTPVFAELLVYDNETDSAKRVWTNLYIRPGDQLTFTADFGSKDFDVRIKGKGSENNQPMISHTNAPDFDTFKGDTLPDRIYEQVTRYRAEQTALFEKYKKLYKADRNFIRDKEIDISYSAPYEYYWFQGNNKYAIREAYKRNFKSWKEAQERLIVSKSNAGLSPGLVVWSNENAIESPHYLNLIRTFMLREKERLWQESREHPEEFFKEWYDTDVASGTRLFEADMQNALQERIINRYFKGRPAEFLYAALFDQALHESNPANLISMFDRFQQKFPGSEYTKWFAPSIDSIRNREKLTITNEMTIAPGNGLAINSWEEVLSMMKGKTILLDMWGTWCGPCRQELTNSSPMIRAHFKDKPLDYFYIANYDLKHEEAWKKLIAFFDMKGTHILANETLTKDIMKKVNGRGYPTYVIIRKDGTFELSKAGYPVQQDVLMKQLEEALK